MMISAVPIPTSTPPSTSVGKWAPVMTRQVPLNAAKSEPQHFGFWEMIGQDCGHGKRCGGMTGGKGVPSTFK